MPQNSQDPREPLGFNPRGSRGSLLYRVASNALPAALFSIFAALHFRNLLSQGIAWQLSEVLLTLQLSLAALFFVIRQMPSLVSWNPLDVTFAWLGTLAPSLFSMESRRYTSNNLGLILQILGNLMTLIAYFSLGRSFGIVPANRGIKTGGLYRWVRHPIYASYQFCNLGYFLNHPNRYNFAVGLVALLSQIYRIFAEEKLLDKDPEYRSYKAKVKWRLLPGVF